MALPWLRGLPLPPRGLFVVGFASTSYRAVDQGIIQTLTADAYRGRVMSMYLLDRGLAPLGALFAGSLAAALGVRDAVLIMGILTAGFAIGYAIRMPGIRRLA